ncbi:MAG: hypothetical protein ACFB9N_18320 [Geitlerinemataceae cyanobacterium]
MTISSWIATRSLSRALAIAVAVGLLLGWGLDRAAIAQFRPGSSPVSAVSWEYRSLSTSEASDPGNARFFNDLSDLGDEGFEMVTCLYAQERRDDESTTVCYFKRPQ